jgi:hypothetical protein
MTVEVVAAGTACGAGTTGFATGTALDWVVAAGVVAFAEGVVVVAGWVSPVSISFIFCSNAARAAA